MGDGWCARCLVCYTVVIKDSVVGLIMLYLQKFSEGFLVFVIHNNYLLQWYYTDIWCILHFKFNILVIFSIRAVSKCQCLCIRTIPSCVYTMGIPLTALLRSCLIKRGGVARQCLCRVSYCLLWFFFLNLLK